jgi:hypothetical protein
MEPRRAFLVSGSSAVGWAAMIPEFRRWFLAGEIAYHGDAFAWELVDWNRLVAPRLTRLLSRLG